MKKIVNTILLLIAVVSFSKKTDAQPAYCGNVIKTTTTDWRSPTSLNQWNWTQTVFSDIYVKNPRLDNPNPGTYSSPFFPPSATGQNPDLLPFYNAPSYAARDFHPEDGWELLAKDFGAPGGSVYSVSNPFFALYNKYTSVMRVFLLIIDRPTSVQNGAFVSFKVVGARDNGLLANSFSYAKPLEQGIDKNGFMQSPNSYTNELDYWLYADFPIAYDPCICAYPSTLEFNFQLISNADITLSGDMTGQISQIIKPGGIVQTNEFKSILENGQDYIEAGKKSYKTWQGYENKANSAITYMETNLKSKMIENIGKLKTFTSLIPEVGALVGLYNFIHTGGKQTPEVKQPTPMLFEANLKFKLNGSLTQASSFGVRQFWTPGSNITATTLKPIYDNVMGVFSVYDAPEMASMDYDATGGVSNIKIRQYKVIKAPRYVVNPASGLRIKSIEAAVSLKYENFVDGANELLTRPGLMETGKPVEFGIPNPAQTATAMAERYQKAGFELEQWPNGDLNVLNSFNKKLMIRTPYTPLSCFTDQSFFLYVGNLYSIPVFYCKLIVKLERIDGQGQDVLIVQSYRMNVHTAYAPPYNDNQPDRYNVSSDPVTQTYYPTSVTSSNNPGGPVFPMPMAGVYGDVTLQNTTLTSNLRAFGTITINDNVKINSGVTVTAGKKIEINTKNTYDPSVKFEIGQSVAACSGDVLSWKVSDSELGYYCKAGGFYDTNTKRTLRTKGTETAQTELEENEIENSLTVYPNPTTGSFILNVMGENKKEILILDLLGKVVYENHTTTDTQFGISLENHPKGIYFVKVTDTNGNTEVKKIIYQ